MFLPNDVDDAAAEYEATSSGPFYALRRDLFYRPSDLYVDTFTLLQVMVLLCAGAALGRLWRGC